MDMVTVADTTLEALMESRIESLLIELGAIKGACQGVERDFGRLSEDVSRNAEAWRQVAVEQGALRASIDRVTETVRALDTSMRAESTQTNTRIAALEKSVQPLIDWQRTGARLAVVGGGILFAIWAVFGSGVQKMGADIITWITHRAP